MHREIPELKRLSVFAQRMSPPLNSRSFIRHCDIGTFHHYRIGTAYKMSEADWQKNISLIESEETEKKRGRKTEIFEKLKLVENPISLESKELAPKIVKKTSIKSSKKEVSLIDGTKKEVYCFIEAVALSLCVSEKTLITLAQMGEFELGKITGKIIIEKSSLLSFLNRVHFIGTKIPNELPAYDGSGKIKPFLSFVSKKHTEIPLLKKINDFVLRTDPPLDSRSFIQHCDIGTFYHYRIGTAYRLSEEDWTNSLQKITKLGDKTKSNRGKKHEFNLLYIQ